MPSYASDLASLMREAAALERSGQWTEASDAYAAAFRHASQVADLSCMADALRGQSRTRQCEERFAEAEELAELSRAIAECNGLAPEAARAVNVLAVIRYRQQDWSGAQELYQEALDRAFDAGDDQLIASTCQNLGILANILGNLREARVRYLEGIASAIRAGAKVNEAETYNNLAMVCADLEEWMEADLYFERGSEIAERIPDSYQLARLYMNRAEPLIQLGELDKARETLARASEIASQIKNPTWQAEMARFRGMIARMEGDFPAAERLLTEAHDCAVTNGLGLERPEALRELAVLRWEQGRREEALSTLEEAQQLFQSLGADWEVARVVDLRERWRREEGRVASGSGWLSSNPSP